MAPTIKRVPPTKFKHLVKRTAGSRVAAPPTVLTSTTGNGAEPMAEAILISRLRAEPVPPLGSRPSSISPSRVPATLTAARP